MIKDSGTRREFESGAVRDIQEGKGMNDISIFTDALIENAYRIVISNVCKTEKEKAVFTIICQSCDKNGISVRKYLDVVSEVAKKTKELEDANDCT